MIVAFLFHFLVAGRTYRNQVIGTIRSVWRIERAIGNDVMNIQLTRQILFRHTTGTAFERISLSGSLSNFCPVPPAKLGSAFEPDLGSMIVSPKTPASITAEMQFETLFF
jgi:hypothetical protein